MEKVTGADFKSATADDNKKLLAEAFEGFFRVFPIEHDG